MTCIFDWADIARRTAKTAAQTAIAAFPVDRAFDLTDGELENAAFVAGSAGVVAGVTFVWNAAQQWWKCREGVDA